MSDEPVDSRFGVDEFLRECRIRSQRLRPPSEQIVTSIASLLTHLIDGVLDIGDVPADLEAEIPAEWFAVKPSGWQEMIRFAPRFDSLLGEDRQASLRQMCDTILNLLPSSGTPSWISEDPDVDDSDLLDYLGGVLNYIRDTLGVVSTIGQVNLPPQLIERWLQSLRQLADHVTTLESSLAAAKSVQRIQSFRDWAEASAEAASEAAGVAAGESGVGGAAVVFRNFSKRHSRYCWGWRFAAIGLSAGSALLALAHLSNDSLTPSQIVQRVAIGLPLAIAISYSLYEASAHRSHAVWAKHVNLQLRTVRAYCFDLSPDDASALRLILGGAVYSGPPAIGKEERHAQVTPELLQLLSSIATRR